MSSTEINQHDSTLQDSTFLGPEFLDQCRKMISFDTSPHSSTIELVEYLKNIAESFGLKVEVITEFQNGEAQANIIVRANKTSTQQKEFLLQTHLDTADSGAFPLWKKNNFNPFDAIIEENKIYGLGSADVKLDFLCKLYALKHFSQTEFNSLSPVLVGTFGEETGMQGALKLIRKNKLNARFALIGEPSNFKIINAAKGFATVEMRIPYSEKELELKKQKSLSESATTQTKIFSGKSAHSSTPHLGDNAALKLLEYLSRMPENMVIVEVDAGTRYNMIPHQGMVELDLAPSFEASMISKMTHLYQAILDVQLDMMKLDNTQFEPHYSTLSLGLIKTFEDYVLIGGSCRILPNVQQTHYEQWMTKISKACEEVGAQFLLQDYKRPFSCDDNSTLVKGALSELQKLNISSHCQSLASTNEASLFSRVGIECICIGAGVREGNVHTPNEHVQITDLNKMTLFYKNMIERFCL